MTRRRGRASTGVLAGAFVVCLVLVAALWLATRDGAANGESARENAVARGASSAAAHDTPLEGETPARTNAGPDAPVALAARGTIRGEVTAQRGSTFPQAWTLLVEPSPVLGGRERGASRRIDFTGAERTFHVDDLPLAGYRLRPVAPGLNGTPADVLLLPSSANVFVTLAFAPAGFVDGLVREDSGAPAEALDVTLEDVLTHARRTTNTDPQGMYTFADVVDGEYRVWLGSPDAPLVPAIDVVFRAPTLRVPERKLPPLGGLDLQINDDGPNFPRAAGARVWGSTSARGAVDTFADDAGLVKLRHLVPGTWHIEAALAERASGIVEIEVTAGQVTTRQLQLRP